MAGKKKTAKIGKTRTTKRTAGNGMAQEMQRHMRQMGRMGVGRRTRMPMMDMGE